MFVDNYYKFLLRIYSNGGGITGIEHDGSTCGFHSENWKDLVWTSSHTTFYFGTNNTKTTKEDYWLQGTKIENLKILNKTYQYEKLSDGIKITNIMNVHNSGSEPATIGEMVWYTCFDSSGYLSSDHGIIDRTAFDELITIPPGGSKQINYSIFFKYGV